MTNWKVFNMERVADTGLVLKVTYGCMLSKDGIIQDRKIGMHTFEGNMENPNFIPYENLTEDIVLGWMFDILGDKVEAIENELIDRQAQRELEAANKSLSGVPW
jgi:hypothetical protein